MAISYKDSIRNARMDLVSTDLDTGAGAPILRIYDGTRPANGGTATNVLAELTMSDPSVAAGASGGVLTFDNITSETNAPYAGTNTATWFRLFRTDGTTIVADGSVGATGSGADLELDSTSITQTQTVSVSTFTITEGNDYNP